MSNVGDTRYSGGILWNRFTYNVALASTLRYTRRNKIYFIQCAIYMCVSFTQTVHGSDVYFVKYLFIYFAFYLFWARENVVTSKVRNSCAGISNGPDGIGSRYDFAYGSDTLVDETETSASYMPNTK